MQGISAAMQTGVFCKDCDGHIRHVVPFVAGYLADGQEIYRLCHMNPPPGNDCHICTRSHKQLQQSGWLDTDAIRTTRDIVEGKKAALALYWDQFTEFPVSSPLYK